MLETPYSIPHHSVAGNGKRDGLKSEMIGQSAAKHRIVYVTTMKVQRLAGNGVGPSGSKCGASMRQTLEERFFAKIAKNENGCHEWTGHIMPNGYGQMHKDGKTAYAHRVAYDLAFGAVAGFVLHHCDNRKCVNPEHLFVGTHDDNMQDMVAKSRHAFGDKNGRRKLSAEQVRSIRSEIGLHREIAAKYGVTPSLVSMIRSGRIWRDV
jgi:hypothetical protein